MTKYLVDCPKCGKHERSLSTSNLEDWKFWHYFYYCGGQATLTRK